MYGYKIVRQSLLLPLVFGLAVHAEVIHKFRLTTTQLAGHPAGPFTLALQFAPGDGTRGNNYAWLKNIRLGMGGAPCGTAVRVGGAFGQLSSSIGLIDSERANTLEQCFIPGDRLEFDLVLSTNLDGDIPDGFVLAILDKTGSPIPTVAGGPFDVFATVYIDSENPSLQLYGGDGERSPSGGGAAITLPPPTLGSPVLVDIKPGDSANTMNPTSSGSIPVAIMSSATFDAPKMIDLISVRFGRTGNEASLEKCNPQGEDVNGDGHLDLTCHFSIALAGFQSGDSAGVLRAKTLDAQLVEGKDSIRTVP